MHAEYLGSEPSIEINLHGLFTEAGMIPEGGLWVVPTETFMRIWGTAEGAEFRERGFRLESDGKSLGASQDCVVHIPVALMQAIFPSAS